MEKFRQGSTTYGNATFWTQDNGILFCKLRNLQPDLKLDCKSASLYLDAIRKLSADEPVPLLIDLRDTKGTFSNDAAHLLSDSFSNMPFVICEAYVVNSLSVKLLVQAYKRIYKTNIPYALFNRISDAETYCLAMTAELCQ